MAWGSFRTGDGQFRSPTGMTVQYPQGNVYVFGNGNHRIQEFTNDGKFINKWDLPSSVVLNTVRGVDIDVNSAGTFFLTNGNANTIDVISATPVTQK